MKVGYLLADGVKGYTQWRKALWTDDELLKRFTARRQSKWDARQVAEVIAMFGTNGRNCFPSAGVVGERLGCRRAVVDSHRKWLIGNGWFREGRAVGRTVALDIAMPDQVAWEWRTGDRSWKGKASGVFKADLMSLSTGMVMPSTSIGTVAPTAPEVNEPNWYPDNEWAPDLGTPPF